MLLTVSSVVSSPEKEPVLLPYKTKSSGAWFHSFWYMRSLIMAGAVANCTCIQCGKLGVWINHAEVKVSSNAFEGGSPV